MTDLRLDWCSYKAAKFAVTNWHYSRKMPRSKVVTVGVWEDGRFIGAVVFGRGASANIGKPYKLQQTEICELVRVALTKHKTPVSRIIAIAVRMLRRHCPSLRLIVSFADTNMGHHGGIYQAAGWLYLGQTQPRTDYKDKTGRIWHNRCVSERGVRQHYGRLAPCPRPSECEAIPRLGKHRYVLPLDDAMREQVAPLAKPYPKRPKQASVDTPVRTRRGSADPVAPASAVELLVS